jgi:hypothetical protein
MKEIVHKAKILCLLFLTTTLLGLGLTTTHPGLANAQQQNNTLMQPQEKQGVATNGTKNIVLVHGGWADGSGWSKEIPILTAAGHKVTNVYCNRA